MAKKSELLLYSYESKNGYGTLRGDLDVWNEELSVRVLFRTLFKRRLKYKHKNKQYIYIYTHHIYTYKIIHINNCIHRSKQIDE